MKKHLFICPLFLLIGAAMSFSQSPDEERLALGGSIEGEWSFLWSNAESPLYALTHFGQEPASVLSQYGLALFMNGDYTGREIGAHVHTVLHNTKTLETDFALLALYGEYYISDSLYFFLGKKPFVWGKGYAFNPVNFAAHPKDPQDPELAIEGTYAAGLEYTVGFPDAILSAVSFGVYALPSIEALTSTDDFLNTSIAGKLYALFLDIDIDIMALYGKKRPIQFGADFSLNIFPELELHGELGFSLDLPKYVIEGATIQAYETDAASFLAGLRWLSPWNMTTVIEYYRNGAGLTRDEFSRLRGYWGDVVDSGSGDSISEALVFNKTYFNASTLMTDYLYLKMTQPEPFGLVDVTASLYSIVNAVDWSAIAGLILGIKPVTNIEVTLQSIFYIGSLKSELGSKPYWFATAFEGAFSF